MTRTERLILANQYLILEHVDPDNADVYSKQRKVMEHGYSLHYAPEHIDEGELAHEACIEIQEILQMHRMLKFGWDALDDKDGITEGDIQFHGFDGNNEWRQLGYVMYYINDMGRFDELRMEGYNSHMPSLEMYRRMLQVWKPFEGLATRENRSLATEEMRSIIEARKYLR